MRKNIKYSFTLGIIFLAGLTIEARCEQKTYQNPMDHKSYTADWTTYNPEKEEKKDPNARVEIQLVRLLSPQDLFGRSIQSKDLSEYIKKMRLTIENNLPESQDNCEILIQTTLSVEEKPKFQITYKDIIGEEVLQKIYDGLQELPDFRSQKDVLLFQVSFQIKKKPLFIPK